MNTARFARRLCTLGILGFAASFCAFPGVPAARAQMATLPLWPHATPEPPQTTDPEIDVTKPTDALISGHRSARYTNVTKPTMAVYPPPAGRNTGAAALVFPGGGYVRLAWDGEGLDTCKWLNSVGLTCLLVKYRVPEKGRYPENYADFEDAQQAMRLARAHAAEWHIDPAKIGVIGFSAGAHLAITLSTHWDDEHVKTTPAAADVDATLHARPNFALIIYPGYVNGSNDLNTIDAALVPRANTPPTFLLQAENDSVHVENALLYFKALKDAKVPAEMHIFAEGGHGFGVFPAGKPEEHWTQLATTWLQGIGMIPASMQRSAAAGLGNGATPPMPCPNPAGGAVGSSSCF